MPRKKKPAIEVWGHFPAIVSIAVETDGEKPLKFHLSFSLEDDKLAAVFGGKKFAGPKSEKI